MDEKLIKQGKLFKHYKNGKIYTILTEIAQHTETEEKFVVYSCGDGNVWIRPIHMFCEKIEYLGEYIFRFTPVCE